MAASTLANLAAGLKRIYSDETFEYAQNAASPLLEKIDELDEIVPEGEGYYWPFMLESPQNYTTPAEDGNIPPIKQRLEVQGHINAGQFVGAFEISFMLEAVGTARGSWNKGEVKKHSFDTLSDLVKHRNRIYAGTYGTGLIAKVETNVVATNGGFVAQLDTASGAGWGGSGQGALLLRPKQTIDIRLSTNPYTMLVDAAEIESIDQATRTVTLVGDPSITVNAGDGVYITRSYGQSTVPNGLMNLVDDGEFAQYIHNVDRDTYTALKSLVFRNGGTLRSVSEDDLVSSGFLLRTLNGGVLDTFVMNVGQWYRLAKTLRPLRYSEMSGVKKPASMAGGIINSDDQKFFLDGRPVDIVVSEDVAPRHIYGLDMSTLRKIQLRKLGWLDHGGGSMFTQGVDSGGFKTTRVATMYSIENIGCEAPWRNVRWQDLLDPILCGPTFGGQDADEAVA